MRNNQFHVGRGTTRGALTVFPIWAEAVEPVTYSTDCAAARIGECPNGARVDTLNVWNASDVPLLMLEGQLLEGGLQHRMVAGSVLIAPSGEWPLAVVCVEQGRWHGAAVHGTGGRRVSPLVRAGLRLPDAQAAVWHRIRRYEAERGPTRTESYLDHADRDGARIRDLARGLAPLPGQVGVLIGMAGQPLLAEVFDAPATLAQAFPALVEAAAMDALGMPPIATPGRRARRFLRRAEAVHPRLVGRAGIAERLTGRNEHVELSTLRWQGHDLHIQLTNRHHDLVLAA